MEQLWPSPTPEAADVIRSVSDSLLTEADAFTEAVTQPARDAQNDPALTSDASLAAEDRQVNRSDLVQWLTSNIQHPGCRVDPYFGSRTTAYFRDLASRGIEPDFAGGWRAGLAVAWRRWLEECLRQCDDPGLLVEVLDIVAQSMAQYAIDWFAALREASIADAVSHADADAIAMIQLIASGAPVPRDYAESRLNYRLARWHQALVLWSQDPEHVDAVEEVVAAVRATEAGRNALVARASATSRWMWLSGSAAPDLHEVEKVVAKADDVQATAGRAGRGLEGFRSSHQDALAAQAMLVRLGADRRFTAYADVELIDTLTKDRASARRFVVKTLGPLAEADAQLREALLTYVQCGFNTTKAAAHLYAHRNTVDRRVSRANELSVVKVEDNPTHVAAALLVMEVAPDIAASIHS
ncbi:helix-turn-helix domain-containing protein [Nocardioides panacisoli]|uniref:helix-turn-helix domain-containing protein n=1 Tax=Nocardioides panacisoli TaxID=627624 RepID=UPI001C629333|nr:helix-turn-helix domain-containing protein [Nocardioides panacisoli]QYJ03510.1 helix-turn-helix domain-containing protein [Nocardioides panacisoli]